MGGLVPATFFVALAVFALGWYFGRRRGMAEDRLTATIRTETREQADRVIVAVLKAQTERAMAAKRATLYAPDRDRESEAG